ncbi:Acyl carrier protein [Buchnera aphidicola (Tetraneura ulmi)]|uniref:acyl carrier protein n=1 Tax=Buchnera aphidicola TaxID=9 RepID=UPI003463F581
MIDIEKKIKKIISVQLGKKIEKISRKSSYVKDLEADSLDMIEFVMNLEEKFKINIPDEDMQYIKTIEDTIKYIKSKIVN